MNRQEIENKIEEYFDWDFLDIRKRDIRNFLFDEILPEVLRDLQFTSRDIQLVWEHYWDWDYSPTHRELDLGAQSVNYQFQKKAREKYNITL